MTERLYSTYQVADLLGATPSAVVEWMQKGWLPFQRLPDGPIRISEKGLIEFLKRQGIDIEEVMAKAVLREDRYKSIRRKAEEGSESPTTDKPMLPEATEEKGPDPSKSQEPEPQPVPVEPSASPSPPESSGEPKPIEPAREAEMPEPVPVEPDREAETPEPQPVPVEPSASPSPPESSGEPKPIEPAREAETPEPVPVEPDREAEMPEPVPVEPDREAETPEPVPVEPDREAKTPEPVPVEPAREAEVSAEPASQIAEAILQDAVARRVSHVHLERRAEGLSLRLRIDGVLHEKTSFAARLPDPAAGKLIDQFKSMAEPHIAGGAQTLTRTIDGRPVEFDLSCIATAEGEKIVLAVRDSQVVWDLSRLNLSADESRRVNMLLRCPCGLIVVAGIPRAGRELTLWSMGGQIDRVQRSVASVGRTPAPRLKGVTPRTVQTEDESGDPEGIAALAAADTDVILIDELRGPQAILAALDAARCGALILGGLTALDARQGLGRILSADPSPWALLSSLLGVLAVRTPRKLCDDCKATAVAPDDLLEDMNLTAGDLGPSVCRSGHCDACGKTGYVGMAGVLSILEADETVADLLRREATTEAIENAALEAGTKSLRQMGLEKVNAGVTTLEELARVLPL